MAWRASQLPRINRFDLVCRGRLLHSVDECRTQFCALSNTVETIAAIIDYRLMFAIAQTVSHHAASLHVHPSFHETSPAGTKPQSYWWRKACSDDGCTIGTRQSDSVPKEVDMNWDIVKERQLESGQGRRKNTMGQAH